MICTVSVYFPVSSNILCGSNIKSLFCSKIHLTYFKISKGDTQVGIDHIKDGNIVWGCTVIMLQFLPNVVFIVWFILANQGHLREAGTWKNIAIAGSVQLVTLIR